MMAWGGDRSRARVIRSLGSYAPHLRRPRAAAAVECAAERDVAVDLREEGICTRGKAC